MNLRDFQLLQDHQGLRQVPSLLCFRGDHLFLVAQVLQLVLSIPADPEVRSIQLVPGIEERRIDKIIIAAAVKPTCTIIPKQVKKLFYQFGFVLFPLY